MEKLIFNKKVLISARELSRSQIRKVMGGGGVRTTGEGCPLCSSPNQCTREYCPDCVLDDPFHNPPGICMPYS